MKPLVVLALALSGTVTVTAQTIDGYEIRYYNAGATSPFQWATWPVGSYACNQTPTVSSLVSNPTSAEWDDPAANGRVCRHVEVVGGPLLSFPVGAYEATLRAYNSVGASPESNRAPFVVGAFPGAPTNFRIVR